MVEEEDEEEVEEDEDEDGATTASLKYFQVTTSQPGGVTRQLQWDETGEESLHRARVQRVQWEEFSLFMFLSHPATWPGPGTSELTQGEGVVIISERVESVLEDGQSAVEVLRRFLGESVAEIICLHAISVGLQ